MWRLSGVTPVQPPIKRKLPAKLEKKRAREPNELTSRKVGIFKQCKACGKLWHNRKVIGVRLEETPHCQAQQTKPVHLIR